MGRNYYGSFTSTANLSHELFTVNDTFENSFYNNNTNNKGVEDIFNSRHKSLETTIEDNNTNKLLNRELFTPNDTFDNPNDSLDDSLHGSINNNEAENILKLLNEETNTNQLVNNEISGIKVAKVLIQQLCSEIDFLRDEIVYLRKDNVSKTDIIKNLTSTQSNNNKFMHNELQNTDVSTQVDDSNSNFYSSITSDTCSTNGKHPINNYEVNTGYDNNIQGDEPFRRARTKSRGKKVTSSYTNDIKVPTIKIPTKNRFAPLRSNYDTSITINHIHKDENYVEVPYVPLGNPEGIFRKPNTRRPTTVIQKYPERNVLKTIPPKHKRIVPGKNTYAEITTYGRKVCIFGDSIPQRLDMKKFNTNLARGYAFKRSFPSGTVKQLKHYVIETINDEDLDAIIINVGLNSLGRQTDYEIVSGIIEMVHLCHAGGINDVLVSGLTHKDGFTNTIKNINEILKINEKLVGFTYIDNSNIEIYKHLWEDKLHLNNTGLDVLLVNFVNALNRLP